MTSHAFPTPEQEAAANTVLERFASLDGVDAVLLTGSCARGKAVPTSDLDMVVLVDPRADASMAGEAQALASSSDLTLHVDVETGVVEPTVWDDGGGPDDFELNIGNWFVYSAPLWQRGDAFERRRARWLPYYDEQLRSQRMAMVREALHRDLDAVAHYAARGERFWTFDRLYKAFREFLQLLFIDRRTYPIAYNKWIDEQVSDILGLPELHEELPIVLEVPHLDEIELNARHLRSLLDDWVPEDGTRYHRRT